ncbi:hypothetical protein [Algoriphagus litoralis]|uniref:hypothetical protein n=1 Tax=Algoriphagus litoralis TaxID=2202829 RepID=UPI000DB94002|nr:hypothetical protein [Algoriphagus litoralis]
MKKLLFALLFLAFGFPVKAQFFIAGGHFNGGLATGQLKSETGGLFFPSLSGILLHEARSAPIQVGLELGYGIYGSKLEKRTDLYEGFSDELRLRRNNNIATGMVVIRYLPFPESKLSPFIEAKFGANYLYTRYKIRESIAAEDTIEAGKDFENWTLAHGFGAGVQFPIPTNPDLVLEFKANYQSSNSLRFLTKGDTTFDPLPNGGGTFDYEVRSAPLTKLSFSIGILVYDAF